MGEILILGAESVLGEVAASASADERAASSSLSTRCNGVSTDDPSDSPKQSGWWSTSMPGRVASPPMDALEYILAGSKVRSPRVRMTELSSSSTSSHGEAPSVRLNEPWRRDSIHIWPSWGFFLS